MPIFEREVQYFNIKLRKAGSMQMQMQMQIELSDDQARLLDFYAQREKLSEHVLIQHLVAEFLARKREEDKKAFDAGFGMWGDGEDGLAYQERLRSEW